MIFINIICIFLPFLTLWISKTEAGMVNACSDVKNCSECTNAYVHIFSFKEYCRWCIDTKKCGTSLSCPATSPYAMRDSFKCPIQAPTAKGKRYTDKLGRSLYSLVLATKTDKPEKCLKNSRPDVKISKYFEVECDQSKNNCIGMTAVSKEAKSLYIIYKGSGFDKQLLQEFIHAIASQFGAWEKFVNNTGVMTYFHSAFQKLFIEGGMLKDIQSLIKQYPTYKLWISGKGLGGSLASMTALYVANKTIINNDKIKLVTFGEPRTGNYLYSKSIEKSISFRYRIIHRNDIVTNIPNSIDPDGAILTTAGLAQQPHFYRYAVHYNNKMERDDDFDICSTPEDHKCRNLAAAIDINDHFNYFGIKEEDYVKSNCKKDILL
ncbi:Lipase, class 3 family-containing protein [Strongyloides ratti]|uniref:Lipase, class 3 family-containing protein n=1 Tax=Strongyloides ratti TaxID=34506 RepID=A0A090L373_STRRB|nr:Lipase, class 3 family-containing protein [Strongyloides ratti]CEF64162.1 Lipase, class 3 family-containing protein [Strongyloides ratti]